MSQTTELSPRYVRISPRRGHLGQSGYRRRTRNRLDQFYCAQQTHQGPTAPAGLETDRGAHPPAPGSFRASSTAHITSRLQANAAGAPATCPAQVRAQPIRTQTARPSGRAGASSASPARRDPLTASPRRRGREARTPRGSALPPPRPRPTFHVPPPESPRRAALTVVLHSLGEAPLQRLVHRLQPGGDVLIAARSLLRPHKLLQRRKHLPAPTSEPGAVRELSDSGSGGAARIAPCPGSRQPGAGLEGGSGGSAAEAPLRPPRLPARPLSARQRRHLGAGWPGAQLRGAARAKAGGARGRACAGRPGRRGPRGGRLRGAARATAGRRARRLRSAPPEPRPGFQPCPDSCPLPGPQPQSPSPVTHPGPRSTPDPLLPRCLPSARPHIGVPQGPPQSWKNVYLYNQSQNGAGGAGSSSSGHFFFFLATLSLPSIRRWPCLLISAREGT